MWPPGSIWRKILRDGSDSLVRVDGEQFKPQRAAPCKEADVPD
jgi:hypothetical protein